MRGLPVSLIVMLLLPLVGFSERPAGRVLIGADALAENPPAPFELAVTPVTNAEYLEFVRANPEWQKSKVKRIFADSNYLKHWAGDLDLGENADALACAPVTYVSWFAARAYAEWSQQRLPTITEWEFAAAASATSANASNDPVMKKQILAWYARPTPSLLPCVETAEENYYGIRGMHGLVWEWLEDFNSDLLGIDSRGAQGGESALFCGGGGAIDGDRTDYAEFMRRAFRGSLQARFCLANLGFRCAR